jgi:hypothetical protein
MRFGSEHCMMYWKYYLCFMLFTTQIRLFQRHFTRKIVAFAPKTDASFKKKPIKPKKPALSWVF